MGRKPKVSVIVPNFRQMECAKEGRFPYTEFGDPIPGCLESVKSQDYPNIEIIRTSQMNPNMPIEIMSATRLRRTALNYATGDIVLFLDGDVILVSNKEISNLVKVFQEVDTDVVIGSSVPNPKNPLFLKLLAVEYEEREKNMGEGYVLAGATTYMAFRKEVFKKIELPIPSPTLKGRKNPFFESGFLDWDLSGIMIENGLKLWHTKKFNVHHMYQTTAWGYFKKQFWHGWYRPAYIKRFKTVLEGYIKPKMILQPFLLFLLPLGILWFPIIPITLIIMFFYELPLVVRKIWEKKDISILLLLPITFIRSITWFMGGIKGVIDFYIRGIS